MVELRLDVMRMLLDAGCSQAVLDVVGERIRQVTVEGYTTAHDDEHNDGSLPAAAAVYALLAARDACREHDEFISPHEIKGLWPWDGESLKSRGAREDLKRAAAMLIAEIERIDRSTETAEAREARKPPRRYSNVPRVRIQMRNDLTGQVWIDGRTVPNVSKVTFSATADRNRATAIELELVGIDIEVETGAGQVAE